METLKRRERLKTLTANALKTSAAVSGFSRDIEEQRKEIADKEAQIARLREEIAMAQLSIERMERERAPIDCPDLVIFPISAHYLPSFFFTFTATVLVSYAQGTFESLTFPYL